GARPAARAPALAQLRLRSGVPTAGRGSGIAKADFEKPPFDGAAGVVEEQAIIVRIIEVVRFLLEQFQVEGGRDHQAPRVVRLSHHVRIHALYPFLPRDAGFVQPLVMRAAAGRPPGQVGALNPPIMEGREPCACMVTGPFMAGLRNVAGPWSIGIAPMLCSAAISAAESVPSGSPARVFILVARSTAPSAPAQATPMPA